MIPLPPRARVLAALVAVACVSACAPEASAEATATRPAAPPPEGAVALRFERDAGDTLRVFRSDADGTEQVVVAAPPTEGGFLRGLVPALQQDRRIGRGDPEAPFYFSRGEDGEPVLLDPTTGNRIDLLAFGPGARDFVAAVVADAPSREEDA